MLLGALCLGLLAGGVAGYCITLWATSAYRKRAIASRWFVYLGYLLVMVAVGVAGWQIGLEMTGQRTGLEAAIGELSILVGGLAGSWIVSRSTMRMHARSAFRRVWSLYQGLAVIASEDADDTENIETTLARIKATAAVHHLTVGHALEDWRDLLPHEVDELIQQLGEQGSRDQSETSSPLPLAPGSIRGSRGGADG